MSHEQMNGASISPKKAADFESKPSPASAPSSPIDTNVPGSYKPKAYGSNATSADPTAIPLRKPSHA